MFKLTKKDTIFGEVGKIIDERQYSILTEEHKLYFKPIKAPKIEQPTRRRSRPISITTSDLTGRVTFQSGGF